MGKVVIENIRIGGSDQSDLKENSMTMTSLPCCGIECRFEVVGGFDQTFTKETTYKCPGCGKENKTEIKEWFNG